MVAINKPNLFIVYYSTYSHVYKLAKAIQEGAEKEGKVKVSLYQIPETLSEEVLGKMGAPAKPDVPVITPSLLKEADGILFGIPTRFGTVPAQVKDFIDSCGQLWMTGALNGKLGGIFTSTQTQHGGQESTAFTFLTILTHFGMLYVPNGYSTPLIQEDKEVIGGSPWGASVVARNDIPSPNDKEIEIGRIQGQNFANYLAKFNGVSNQVPATKVQEVTKAEVTKNNVQTENIGRKKSKGLKSFLKTAFSLN
ncbi:flavoprotein WrbA [Neoconidiobolus thromboides FSU 785]|nr:flavoprotein WrbA [Neoconidiobolus thromboides FSU 785]